MSSHCKSDSDHSLEVSFLRDLTSKDFERIEEGGKICEKLLNNEKITEEEERVFKDSLQIIFELQRVQKLQDWKNEQQHETRFFVKFSNLLRIKVICLIDKLLRSMKIRKDGGRFTENLRKSTES